MIWFDRNGHTIFSDNKSRLPFCKGCFMSEVLTKRDAALAVLEEVLLAARRAAEEARTQEENSFQSGKVAAYYDVLTVALEQAELVELDPVDFGLGGFDPDSLLSAPRKAA